MSELTRRRDCVGTAGVSLVEILVVLALFVILAGIAIPQITKYYRTYKFNRYVSEVESTIKWARLVAMERGVEVHLSLEGAGSELRIYARDSVMRAVSINLSDQAFVIFEGSGFPVGFDARGLVMFTGQASATLKVKRTDTNACVKFEFIRMSGYINKGPC